MNVEWSALAEEDWRRLPLDEAVQVPRAVRRFAEANEGLVIYVEGEYRLFVGNHVVSMLIDADTLHVDRVRHA